MGSAPGGQSVAFLEFLDGRFDVEAAPRTRSLSIQSDMLLATDSFLGAKVLVGDMSHTEVTVQTI